MAKTPVFNLGAINLAVNPLLHKPGDLLRSVNVETFPFGAKRKRPGYITTLGTMPNGSVVQDLANFTLNNGTQFWNYALAGGLLYSSQQGTGAWTITGNGTLSSSGTLCMAVLENTVVVGDGVSATRHSTNGTSFTNTSSAPIAVSLADYHQRIFAAGTSSNLFWSNVGTPTDWTNDSSSVLIPGPGKLLNIFKTGDRSGDALIASKNSGQMHSFDEFARYDLSTQLGPTSSRSIGSIEGYRIYLNRQGYFGFGAESPKLLSNAIERQIYNDRGSGIIGTTFDNAPGAGHLYRYYASVGTVTDDLTNQTVGDAVHVYDFKYNEFYNYKFAHRPTAWLSFKDNSSNQQLWFGAGSQVYQVSGTATSDAGTAIESVLEGVLHLGSPELDKEFKYLWAFANPGCEGHVQVAISDTFTKGKLNWQNLGDFVDGVAEYNFPEGSRGKLLFWRFAESSRNDRFELYGFSVDAEVVPRN